MSAGPGKGIINDAGLMAGFPVASQCDAPRRPLRDRSPTAAGAGNIVELYRPDDHPDAAQQIVDKYLQFVRGNLRDRFPQIIHGFASYVIQIVEVMAGGMLAIQRFYTEIAGSPGVAIRADFSTFNIDP